MAVVGLERGVPQGSLGQGRHGRELELQLLREVSLPLPVRRYFRARVCFCFCCGLEGFFWGELGRRRWVLRGQGLVIFFLRGLGLGERPMIRQNEKLEYYSKTTHLDQHGVSSSRLAVVAALYRGRAGCQGAEEEGEAGRR